MLTHVQDQESVASRATLQLDRPNLARMRDYWLGGFHNFAADRELASRATAALPGITCSTQANRAFLIRAVQYSLGVGVRQFLDIGCGIPTLSSVHEVAQRIDPEARVVYAEADGVNLALAEWMLAGNPAAAAIQADVRQPELILAHPTVRRMLDLDRPVAVLLVAVLDFVGDGEDPADLVARLLAPLAAGSHLVLSHYTLNLNDTLSLNGGCRGLRQVGELYRRAGMPLTPRPRRQIERLFAPADLLPPGLVRPPDWRPDPTQRFGHDDVEPFHALAGVARVR
jgi:hypothetical protein